MSLLSKIGSALVKTRESVDEFIVNRPVDIVDELIKELEQQQPSGAIQLSKVPPAKPRLLTTNEFLTYYGEPGDPDNLTSIELPFPMKIAWDMNKTIKKMTLHKKVANRFYNAFSDILRTYGISRVTALEIDVFGGSYNFRPQRGLEAKYEAAIKKKDFKLAYTYLSRHSWAGAIDLNPNKNGLKVKKPKAQFSKPEYEEMTNIFYRNQIIGYGVERNNDYMHWEIGVIE